MIPVSPAKEPADFDSKVRKPGVIAMDEILMKRDGKPQGRKRTIFVADPKDLKSGHFFPYWTECLGDLRSAYRDTCAYSCFYIERVIGSHSVDHFIPKTVDYTKAYEWSNFRLSITKLNQKKSVSMEVLDPFTVEAGWFTIELVSFQVISGESLTQNIKSKVEKTIKVLGLRDPDLCRLREEYYKDYKQGDISENYLKKRAPFLYQEMARQNML